MGAKRVVLAYTGSLDTALCIHWLRTRRNLRVLTFSANLGGKGDIFEGLAEMALDSGAQAAHISDLREEFVDGYVLPALRAAARYESGYYLYAALARPLIVSELVKIAIENDCEYIAHGGAGAGNDQARFSACSTVLAPQLQVLAPALEFRFASRSEQVDYAARHGVPFLDSRYRVEHNLWGIGIAYGPVEDPWIEPPEDAYILTADPSKAPDRPAVIVLDFEKGNPVGLDGVPIQTAELVGRLNEIGGAHGVGRFDVVENRLIGIKSREIYEAPAAQILHTAHEALEDLTLSKEVLHFKGILSRKYSELIYNGLWFNDLRKAIDAFFEPIQRHVSGQVRVKLFKGSCRVTGRRSPYSIYDKGRAVLERAEYAREFLSVWNLPQQLESEGHRGTPRQEVPS